MSITTPHPDRPTTEALALPRIAAVIPAYRAALTIPDVIRAIPAFVGDIIVVDDASPDDLAEAVAAVGDPRVTLLRHDVNGGVGAAVLTGYAEAAHRGADIVVKIDADGQMDPAHIIPLVVPIAEHRADYTKGNRFLHRDALRAMPRVRLLGNGGLSFLTKLATGYWPIFDPTNGYTAIDASLISALDHKRIARRYFFESSMLIEMSRMRGVVHDVYIPAVYRGEISSLRTRDAAREFPLRLLAAAARRLAYQYFLRDFTVVSLDLIVGLLFLTFGVAWGAWHWALSIQTSVPATTGTVMLAVLPVILGTQLLLQAVTLDIQSAPTRPIHPDLRRLDRARAAHSTRTPRQR